MCYFRRSKVPWPFPFYWWKNDLNSYLLGFEKYATAANWPQANWETQLSDLLGGKALELFSKLSQEDALNYGRLLTALLQR